MGRAVLETLKTGKDPEDDSVGTLSVALRPRQANSEIAAPTVLPLACAIDLATANKSSSMDKVVLIGIEGFE